ncbi:MAG: mannose-1-phosphate guanylyltransferase [Polyangiales bacterium]
MGWSILMSVYAVIMAGGSGTRFWPASRRHRPKQLLPLGPDDRTLLRATIDRIRDIVPPERVLIVTSTLLAEAIATELPELPRENILEEPVGRNTAPCVAWAAAHIRRRDPDGSMMVLPADHHIGDEDGYREVLRNALRACEDGALVTVGLTPTRPETGYGYLELGKSVDEGVFAARRFVEKPDRQRAEQFVSAGNFLWNSGMFFFKVKSILAAIGEHLPGLASGIDTLDDAAERGEEAKAVAATYGQLPSVSIDHGIMEKAAVVHVVPGSFGWSDLGSWMSAWELAAKDEDSNAVRGEAVLVDARGNIVDVPPGKVVALVGVEDLVIVDTEDALLVMPRDRAQDVRAVVDALKARKDKRF